MSASWAIAISAGMAALLVACSGVEPAPPVREVGLPAAYPARAAEPNAAEIDWSGYFADEALVSLLSEALLGSFDVQLALQRIELARAGVRAATGALLPVVGVAAGASIRRFGLYTMDGAGNASTDIRPGEPVPTHYPDLSIGLAASWEPDLWGRLASLRDAARAQYLSTLEGTNLVVSTLVAEVSATYFELVAADRVLAILTETLERQQQALQVMRIQKEAARTTELAVQQFEAEVAETRALVADAERQRIALENQLNLLVGRLPRPVERNERSLERRFGGELAAGVPSDLLRNRPDIREAELLVQASSFDLEAARAAFYPNLSISAGAGFQAYQARYLFRTPDSIAYTLAGNLFLPFLNRAELEAQFQTVQASQVQAMLGYQSTVLRAFVEVATTLADIERAREIVELREQKRTATRGAVRSADALFLAGKATYLEVLVAQQGVLEAELELVEALLEQRLAGIRLYRALGGGWREALEARQSEP